MDEARLKSENVQVFDPGISGEDQRINIEPRTISGAYSTVSARYDEIILLEQQKVRMECEAKVWIGNSRVCTTCLFDTGAQNSLVNEAIIDMLIANGEKLTEAPLLFK